MLALLFAVAACDSGSPEAEGEEEVEDMGRGSIVSATRIASLTRAEIQALGLPVAVSNDIAIYQVVYRTVDPSGAETTASGAVMVPENTVGSFSLVSYQHGTVVRKSDVASVGGLAVGEALIGVIFAGAGYVAAMPDYLGLGVSDGLHPFVHGASLASAVVDMLRATRRFAEDEEITLNDNLFLVGYSEGGYATMAAHQVIDRDHTAEFNITAAAPMAGPYDLSGVMAEVMLQAEPYGAPFFLPYTILAYDSVYDFFNDPAEVFVPPLDTQLPPLFDGTRGGGDIDAILPRVPLDMLQPDYVEAFRNDPNHPLQEILRENDVYDWTPRAPMRMYHCEDDELIPFRSTEVALAALKARGANVEVESLTAGGHAQCAAPALLLAKVWFDGLQLGKRPTTTRAEALAWRYPLLSGH